MGFFVVAVGREGEGDAGVVGFDEVVVYGVVEALKISVREESSTGGDMWTHTGPVSVLSDFVDHVPCNCSGHFCTEGSAEAAAAWEAKRSL